MRGIIYDIKAFFLLRREVRRHRNSADWEKYSLRHDWLYRIYTVINPSDKDKGDDESMIQMKAVDRCTPINKYIASMGVTTRNPLGLSEFISLSMEKIPETDSYLVVYYQIYRWFTPWRVFSRLLSITVLAILLTAFWGKIISAIGKLF